VAVDEHYIYCDSQDQVMYEEDLGLKERWKYDRDTGEEIDFDPINLSTSVAFKRRSLPRWVLVSTRPLEKGARSLILDRAPQFCL